MTCNVGFGTIEIRPLQSQQEYRAVEQLQRDVWGLEEVELVPDHVLLTAQKNGGVVLGAFEPLPEEEGERLVGFVFGLVGLMPDGRLKHCSHMLGVAPEYQNRGLGYRLKLAQRRQVLDRGMDLITWTFDPLESRNAHLNFQKLGATCSTYLRNLYGSMRDELNVGLPSDRLQVDWHVASDRVAERLRSDRARPERSRRVGPSLSALENEGVPILNRFPAGDLARPPQTGLPIEGDRVLIQIPSHFQAIRSADMELARAWRHHTRALFEAAFVEGYTIVDHLFEKGRSCYLLKRDWALR